jgi:hypothetical protein
MGCSQDSSAEGALVAENTDAQINLIGAEGDGNGWSIAGATTRPVIRNNRLICPSPNTGVYGVRQYMAGDRRRRRVADPAARGFFLCQRGEPGAVSGSAAGALRPNRPMAIDRPLILLLLALWAGEASAQTSCVANTGFLWPAKGCLNSADLNEAFQNPPAQLANNAALQALAPAGYSQVRRQGFYAAGDGGAGIHLYAGALHGGR